MSTGPLQLGWTSQGHRCSIRYSTGAYWKRFSIVETSTGYTVTDHEQKDCARVNYACDGESMGRDSRP